jgi:hypothetical protein
LVLHDRAAVGLVASLLCRALVMVMALLECAVATIASRGDEH